MSAFDRQLTLKDVLPSAVSIVVLGVVLCFVSTPSWSLFGNLGWWSLPLGALMGLAVYGLSFSLTRLPWLYRASVRALTQQLHQVFCKFAWFDIIVVSCLAGVGEELLLRGVVQDWLVDQFNPVTGIVLASLIFGLMHCMSRIYVVLTSVLGLLFGIALYLTGSMLLVMVAHAVYDVMAFYVIVKRPELLGINVDQNQDHRLPIKEHY